MSEQELLRSYERQIAELQAELANYRRIVDLIGSQEATSVLAQPGSSPPAATDPELNRDILEHLMDGFAHVRPDGTLSYFNSAFARLLGLPPDTSGMHLMDLAHLARCEPFAEALRLVLAGTPRYARCELTDAAGHQRVIECAATAVPPGAHSQTARAGASPLPEGRQAYSATLVIRDQTEREQLLAHMSALSNIATALTRTLDFEQRLDTALAACRNATGADAALIYLIDEDRQALSLARADGFSAQSAGVLQAAPLRIGQGLFGMTALDGEARVVAELGPLSTPDPAAVESERLASGAFAALHDARQIIGVLGIYTRERRLFTDADVLMLKSMASYVGLSLYNARLHSQLQKQAHHDSLTGLFNRGHLMEMAAREYQRARRNRSPLIVLMIDVDRCKSINDQSGHGVGDQALQAIARMLREQTRAFDLVGRYGGDEFMVLLVDCTHAYAFEVIRRLHQGAKAIRILADQGEVELTLSVGMAACKLTENETLDQVLAQADREMYAMKNRSVPSSFGLPALG